MPLKFAPFLLAFLSSPVSAFTLDEIYQRALAQSELVQTAALDVEISRSEREVASTLERPRVNLAADGSYHLVKPDRTAWDTLPAGTVRTELRQPIYDRTVAATLRGSDATITARRWDVATQQQGLYIRVAGLFYELLSLKSDLSILQDTAKVYEQRIAGLREWERIGRTRSVDVFTASTQLELTRSQIVNTQTSIRVAEDQLAWLTSLPAPIALEDKLPLTEVKPSPLPAATVMPTVEAAQARIEAAEAEIDLRRTSLEPRVDLIAQHNWGYYDATEQGQHDFSVGVGLSWTLYDAGSVKAQVNAATLAKSRAELSKQLATRENTLALVNAQRRLNDAFEQIRSLRDALGVVERTLGAQQREYNSGLITNLEFLTTQDQRLQVRRSIELASYRAKLAFVEYQVYAGFWQAGTSGEILKERTGDSAPAPAPVQTEAG